MPCIFRRYIVMTAVCLMLVNSLTLAAAAAELSSASLAASSLVPGQEARYTLKLRVATALNLAKGASVAVDFPSGFNLVYKDGFAADPGCTLARLEYKNSGDRHFAVVYGTVDTARNQTGVQLIFKPQVSQLVIPAETELYLIIPGVINSGKKGLSQVDIRITDAGGALFQGTCAFTLGLAPAAATRQVRLVEASSQAVRLAWDPVAGAKGYRVLVSSQAKGEFISALDLTREPTPGEVWLLTETSHSFAGRGNGGLSPGGTYYFKVQAGNEYGFGPASPVLRVVLPEVKPVYNRQNNGIILVAPGQEAVVAVDRPVKITDQSGIGLYEKDTGVKVKGVSAVVDEKDPRLIRISAKLRSGQQYLLVFYAGALEGRGQIKVTNNNFSFALAADRGR